MSMRTRSMKVRGFLLSVVIALCFVGCADVPEVSGERDEEEATAEPQQVDEQAQALQRRLCGGPLGLACEAGQYCNAQRPGLCPGKAQAGFCAPRPQACTREFRPVCGCNGATFPNKCVAAAAGVAVSHEGACELEGPFCGGIAGIDCPGAGTCIDDPSDDCDPKNGGADCGGVCTCPASQAHSCPIGWRWDGSPEVCACVKAPCDVNPCAATLCQVGTQCVVRDCAAFCEPIEKEKCGDAVCGPGTYCCNPLSSQCTPNGMLCAL